MSRRARHSRFRPTRQEPNPRTRRHHRQRAWQVGVRAARPRHWLPSLLAPQRSAEAQRMLHPQTCPIATLSRVCKLGRTSGRAARSGGVGEGRRGRERVEAERENVEYPGSAHGPRRDGETALTNSARQRYITACGGIDWLRGGR
ncbi:hypothetical protein PsYK624_160950 [Phanerochaete sordida]|uniref:Uncharacterized protein n=1 Tax=Phanerochaete sordida TaxID=48140 RepID=A0A9P3LLK5_9APHY|nr:hypothetical protein PsYK624_160950 [Phanerochaete sordida]